MRPNTLVRKGAAMLLALALATTASAQTPAVTQPKLATDIPPEITTPDRVETRIGTLNFFDGFPTDETVAKVYDNLAFMRGVEVFLNGMRGASTIAIRNGMREVGCVDGAIGITKTLMDSKSLFLTPNTDTVYALSWLDLSKGPVVVESPPNTLGIVDTAWFENVTDFARSNQSASRAPSRSISDGVKWRRLTPC